ncbi:MAG TPA: inner membrane CreD family protein, partial [Candidatus Baltobacteraceae bacterium]
YSTYRVGFVGRYRVMNTGTAPRIALSFPLPAQQATYDDLHVLANGRSIPSTLSDCNIVAVIPVATGRPVDVTIAYHSQGLGQWLYQFGDGVGAARNFDLTMHTNFAAIDYPPAALAPTSERRAGDGWDLNWHYSSLLAGYGIGMLFPERLQPGPLAQRMTLWAPVSLLFYFFVMFIITTIRKIDIHPMNFFFLAASFFAFHLLFAYTLDRMSITAAFLICSIVSMGLTISYLRLVVGLRFAAIEAGLAQFFYLILFSLALFNEGLSGLAITIGAILTLFVTMQLTARIKWGERFATA